jgi:V8-like Glu-specific endopeptidase
MHFAPFASSSAASPLTGLLLPLLGLLVPLALVGCGSNQGPPDALPSFQDLTSAPAPIQKAAEAVVRIGTATESATGAFISATGLLLTNNHVLGTEVCPVEGCYAQLSFGYQRGKPHAAPQSVFVVPVAVSVGLDVAVVQVYGAQGGTPLSTPSFLTVESREASSLLTTHVTLVGHPDGHLKKWTAGEVIETDGSWVWTTAYLLPGNSGSPLLDDAGKLVGIVHRGPTGEGLFTSDGALTYSIGTASAPIVEAMKAPLPPEMISTAAPTSAAAVVAANAVYLNARAPTFTLAAGGTSSVLAALGDACDTGLAGKNYATPEDLSAALAPCDDAESWIDCRTDSASPGSVCPASSDIPLWQQRFAQVNAAWVALNGEVALSPVSFGIASLAPSQAAGLAAGATSLQQALAGASKSMDLGVANYLAAFGVSSYAGKDVTAYVIGYANAPSYPILAASAASAAGWLIASGLLSRDQGLATIAKIYADPSIDTDAKLYIEDLEYGAGVLE